MPKTSPRRRREVIEGYLYISPWFIFFFIFTFGPIVASLFLSFTDFSFGSSLNFVGLQNFRQIFFEDSDFTISLGNTGYYTFLAVPLGLIGSLCIAWLLSQDFPGRTIHRAVIYLPQIIPIVASAYIWMWMFDPQFGIVNNFLSFFGIDGPNWFGSTQWSKPALILLALWRMGGTRCIIFIAGLRNIPDHYYEAATVDGASGWQRFTKITLPLLTPTIFFNMVMDIIISFQVFAEAYVTTQGGPGNSTFFYVQYIYERAFASFQMGYASAIAWILFLIILGFSLFQFAFSKKWVFYR